jgi:drug/metabolite transporter (DMT)-like permease
VTPLGVLLLAATGAAWGVYTAAGRRAGDPRLATTANFLLLGAVLLVPTAVGIAAGLPATAAGVVWGVVMGAGTTAFAYVAWYALPALPHRGGGRFRTAAHPGDHHPRRRAAAG